MRIRYDVVIAGAGIIGLAIARLLLLQEPKLKVLVVEKEGALGAHASGRNSGVLHAGFYYSPGSLKAKFCREGNAALRKITDNHKIPVKSIGKVVVAQNSDEFARLSTLFERGRSNGVQLELLDSKDLSKFEPLSQTYEGFLWSPTTGVSDPSGIIQAVADEVRAPGVEIVFASRLDVDSDLKLSIK